MSNHPFSPRTLPAGYALRNGRFDECVDGTGHLREPWAKFFGFLGPNPNAALAAATEACHRAIVEQDVSMNIYRGERAGAQPWPLDAVPLLIGAAEWENLSRCLRQRAHLFNALLLDIYGDQKTLRNGLVPAALVMANPHYLRPCAGLGRGRDVYLHTYAVDLARAPDGRWWTIEDRLDAPSGLGYSLQNRIITRQALPEVFQRAPVQRLYRFFHDYRASLAALSPHREEPRIVLLSPGAANETYHEHAYLSRYLGYTLVEGEDLSTRDRQVLLRTVGGLKRADVILRRLDSDFCDPLELDARSLLGVPGLLHAAHSGQVGIANLPGARVLETPGLLAFLEPLCRQMLGEDLLMPSVATWWAGHDAEHRYVQENLSRLVLRPAFRTRDSAPVHYGGWMGKAGRAALAARIKAEPWAWCGQERVRHATTPSWHLGALRPMPFITRFYVAWHDGDYIVMPGGLTRCTPKGEDMIVSLQQGSVSKDTWVLHEGPPTMPPALASSSPGESLRHPAATPSRRANNLFWLGRYLERSSQLARKFEKIDSLLYDEIAQLDPGVPADALQLLYAGQDTVRRADDPLADQLALVRELAIDPAHPGSLAAAVADLTRLLEQLKASLPHEGWQLLRQLRQRRVSADVAACAWLRQQLSALESLTNDAMPRDTGWRFLDLGRRIERGQQLLTLLQILLYPPGDLAPTEYRLQTGLFLADSLFTYRSHYAGQLDSAGVIDWLLLSAENPRGFRFQIEKISEHLGRLPAELAPRAVEALHSLAFRLLSEVRLALPGPLGAEPTVVSARVRQLRAGLSELSERVTEIYFSHTAMR